MEEIHLLHTNDLHSHLENWPKICHWLVARKQQLQAEGCAVFSVDLGDFCDRSHPLTEATNGQENVQLMNQAGYDAATIGNNEGVGNSHSQLDHLYDHATFPIILGNLFLPDSNQRPKWCTPYKIFFTEEGTRIGMIGLTAPFSLTYSPNGWQIRKAAEVMPELLAEIKPLCDIVVLLSHLGIDEDRRLAKAYPELSVILGSHTHHLLPTGEQVGKTLVAAAGKFGRYIGEVTLQVENHRLQASSAQVVKTSELISTLEDEKTIESYYLRGEELLSTEIVANLPYTLSKQPDEDHSLIKVALKALEERGKTEAAILNSGLFLESLPIGPVSELQLHQTLPHPMHLLNVTLTGQELSRLLAEMQKNRFFLREFTIRGMGFRGKVFGELCYDGLSFDKTTKLVKWGNQDVIAEKEYTFTTVDHLLFLPFFPTIELAGRNELLFPEFIRNVLGNYLAVHYPKKHKKAIIKQEKGEL